LVVFSLGVLSRSMMDGAHHGTQTKIETKTEGDAK
jgi:hypothetical protein